MPKYRIIIAIGSIFQDDWPVYTKIIAIKKLDIVKIILVLPLLVGAIAVPDAIKIMVGNETIITAAR